METTIKIGKQNVKFKATANTPRLYRLKFSRDMLQDMSHLQQQYSKRKFEIPDLSTFENVAYVMALQADSTIGDTAEWFDRFEIFDIYEIFPELLKLWGMNLETTVESKKNKMKVVAGN